VWHAIAPLYLCCCCQQLLMLLAAAIPYSLSASQPSCESIYHQVGCPGCSSYLYKAIIFLYFNVIYTYFFYS
jgi:hypothetical protein